jgi:hypothetical protein
MSAEINIGDIVEVKNNGQIYSTYESWAVRYKLTNFIWGKSPCEGDVCKVVAKGPHTASHPEDNIILGIESEKGQHFIISTEGVEKITLPEKFKFKNLLGLDYAAELVGTQYEISRNNNMMSVKFSPSLVKKYLDDKMWTIVEDANGTNASGNPFNFTEDMLKPFMRVKTNNGKMWIVVPNVQVSGNKDSNDSNDLHILANKSGWVEFYTDTCKKYGEHKTEVDDEYESIAVYKSPAYNREMLDPEEYGELVWKRTEENQILKDENNFKQRLKYLEDTLDGVRKEVQALLSESLSKTIMN